jgi:hypothetical protein
MYWVELACYLSRYSDFIQAAGAIGGAASSLRGIVAREGGCTGRR